ncbi:hypothetical protein SELMODRAFT_411945 [Selaginella moellendorffii]|uniref:BHLH domain-containing protein n=1 Tax=Selaginella moellendorffii TaxID=88036 RepID=D8RJJ0_SELML|nr:hypothetical protein SELMODRAFT_411945 [Selaginella moellendorffii]
MDPFQGDVFGEFAHDDESLNQLVGSGSFCCAFSQDHHQHHHQCPSFSLDAASSTCDHLLSPSDTDSFGIPGKNHSPGSASENLSIISSSCGGASCFLEFGGAGAGAGSTDSSPASSIVEQAAAYTTAAGFDHPPPPPPPPVDLHGAASLLESWHFLQYESLPGLLHIPEPVDHFSKLSGSSSSPPSFDLLPGGTASSHDDVIILGSLLDHHHPHSRAHEVMIQQQENAPRAGDDRHVPEQELARGARLAPCSDDDHTDIDMIDRRELCSSKEQPKLMEVEASPPVAASHQSNKRQRGCFTLQNVSESLQHHSVIFHNVGVAAKLSEAMLLQINSSVARNPSPVSPVAASARNPSSTITSSSATTTTSTGSGGGGHGSFSYRFKETVEPQSIAARQRRKKISERVRELEKLVPGGNKLDTASMLDEAIRFVKFLQIQVQLLEAVGNGGHGNYGANNHCLNVPLNHQARMFPFSSSPSSSIAISSPCSSSSSSSSSSCASSSCNLASMAIATSSVVAMSPASIADSVLLLGSRRSSSASSSSPLVLTETLQHALFKHKRCVATIQQCPVEHLLL